MKFSTFAPLALLVAGSSASVLKDRAVANNNCGRAIVGTANGASSLSKAKMDCSSNVISYTTVTITPSALTFTTTTQLLSTISATTTVTVTGSTTSTIPTIAVQTITSIVVATSSVTVTVPAQSSTIEPAKRDLSRRSATIPAYASACTNFAEYASACALAGVTQGTSTLTVTAPAQTSTLTSLTTSISTILQTLSTESDLLFTQYSTISSFTTLSTTTTVLATATATACVPSVPAGNVLTNPGFNDGAFDGWNPGGYGGFSNTIVTDAECGPYGAEFSVDATDSYGRIAQVFKTLDATKTYQIQTYAKLVSGNPAYCYYYVTCQIPDNMSSAGNVIIQTPVSSIPSTWTLFTVTCPAGSSSLTMSISLQCNQGTGPVTIGVDETAMYPIS
ncbi:uncharacterized protein LY89DRAFT_668828 [Mollisia scopiformis]|uniref:CBM-cenC domain-containing protein n=1 Tax=Mollisia scopiformis TaxID=149040 RepID=A0A194XBH0_MOLSC|nr:uncharacterized protein LY89DRAFT_668828 [Mollisia scopiformis]KUJ17508.1 hypothetical protein LY89DRAFT_668828 [Mollisia scopiformis]